MGIPLQIGCAIALPESPVPFSLFAVFALLTTLSASVAVVEPKALYSWRLLASKRELFPRRLVDPVQPANINTEG